MTVYATAEQLKAQPGVTSTDDDVVIDLLLSAASSAIDGYCNRPDGFLATADPEERLFAGSGLPYLWVDECVAFSALWYREDASSAWTVLDLDDVAGFQGDPMNPDYNRRPYHALALLSGASITRFPAGRMPQYDGFHLTIPSPTDVVEPTVKVSARWGFATAVPVPVVSATVAQASRWFKRGQSFWADTIGGEYGGELAYRSALDPDIEMMLKLSRLVRPTYAG
jgi:hypothetical protein